VGYTTYLGILNRLGVDHQCNGQTDRQTDRTTIAIAYVYPRALQIMQLCPIWYALCGLRDFKNRHINVYWPNVVKGLSSLVFVLVVGQVFVFVFISFQHVLFCFWLSVAVQSIVRKDSSLKWLIICQVGRKTVIT